MDMFPSPPTPMSASSQSDIDKALARLQDHKNDWHQLSPLKKAVLLEECITEAQTLTEEWIASSCRAKGILRGSPDEGEEWIGSLMPLIRNVRLLIETMKANGKPKIPALTTLFNKAKKSQMLFTRKRKQTRLSRFLSLLGTHNQQKFFISILKSSIDNDPRKMKAFLNELKTIKRNCK